MEQSKCEFVVICQIDTSLMERLRDGIKNDEKKYKEELSRYINNSIPRYHLMPPCKLFGGGIVDFQNIKSIKVDEFEKNIDTLASVNPIFHKDIQARFSHYYGRQGQPQLSKDSILEWIKNN